MNNELERLRAECDRLKAALTEAEDRLNAILTDRDRAVTALRESEQRFRTLVASVPGAVYLSDVEPPWRDTFMSEGVWSLTGYPAEAFLRPDGITFAKVTLPEDLARVSQKIAQGVETRAVISDRYRIRKADGSVRWVMDEARAAYEPSGEPKFLAGVIIDITDLMLAEETRLDLEAQLRESQKMEAMGTLAGGIAHDFNNLLAAIAGHAELLAQDLPPASALQREVSGVLAASQRARNLVQQILTFSHRGERKRVPTAFGPIVQEALSLLRSTLPSAIEIRTEIAPGIPAVLADPTELYQAVVNLATNGAHAMLERGGILSVSLDTVEVDDAFARSKGRLHGGPHVCLRVSDTGHGMDSDTLGRIFEPFFTTKALGEGTGLGLAVVHGIVEGHDGLVRVESAPGKGTTFSLSFPAVGSPDGEESKEEESIPRGRREHLLVLDDEPALVDVACRHLTRLGYRATGFAHPAAALAELRRDPGQFDLVLSDLSMPGMNGLEFAAQVREVRPDIPLILASGYGATATVESLAQLGIPELLSKPFPIATLARAVHRQLHPSS